MVGNMDKKEFKDVAIGLLLNYWAMLLADAGYLELHDASKKLETHLKTVHDAYIKSTGKAPASDYLALNVAMIAYQDLYENSDLSDEEKQTVKNACEDRMLSLLDTIINNSWPA